MNKSRICSVLIWIGYGSFSSHNGWASSASLLDASLEYIKRQKLAVWSYHCKKLLLTDLGRLYIERFAEDDHEWQDVKLPRRGIALGEPKR